jgi:hypothetical protein
VISCRGIERHWYRIGAGCFLLAGALAPRAGAQQAAARTDCTTDTLNAGFPRRWIGSVVGQITIDSRNVDAPTPFLSRAMQFLHYPTRLSVSENELSFGPGDPVDSLRVQESVRRLRRTQLFSEIIVTGTQCAAGTTDFRITTHDAWSIRADMRYGRLTSRVSLAEINLFGTGRSVTAAAEQVDGRNALSFGIVDPHVFNSRFRAAALLRNYGDGRAWQWSVSSRELSPRDPWRAAVMSYQVGRLGIERSTQTTDSISRHSVAATTSWRFAMDDEAAYALVFGVENEYANLSIIRRGVLLGRSSVRRDFTAPLFGIARRSLRFGAINWLVPGQPPAEIPLGFEGETIVGFGRDLATKGLIGHLDGWTGFTSLLTPGTVFTGDAWMSGYFNSDSVSNGRLRLAAAIFHRARRGLWILRVANERVYNPDPDVFALSILDPMLRAITANSRLAETALTITAERSLHLYSTEGRWALDGALFTTYSERHNSLDNTSGKATNQEAIIVGIGFRHVRNQPTQPLLAIDIGKTVWRNSSLPNRWIISFSTVPWLNAGRFRDGVREVTR